MVELPRSLALVAARLNDDARTALIDLLGGELQEQVADLVRRIDLETAELDAYQQQLLAGFDPPARGRCCPLQNKQHQALWLADIVLSLSPRVESRSRRRSRARRTPTGGRRTK